MRALIASCLEEASAVEGVLGAALMDIETAGLLGSREVGPELALDEVAELCAELIASKRKTLRRLGLNDEIEDMIVGLDSYVYVIKLNPTHPNLSWLIILAQDDVNIALASLALDSASKRFVAQLSSLSGEEELTDYVER